MKTNIEYRIVFFLPVVLIIQLFLHFLNSKFDVGCSMFIFSQFDVHLLYLHRQTQKSPLLFEHQAHVGHHLQKRHEFVFGQFRKL
jgi:hypothetical protein